MSDIRPIGAPLFFEGVEYHLLFTVNVIDQIVDRFNVGIDDLKKLIADSKNNKRYANTAAVLTYLINDAIEIENEGKAKEDQKQRLDEKFVRRHMNNMNYVTIFNVIVSAYSLSFLKKDEDDIGEESDPNAEGGQTT